MKKISRRRTKQGSKQTYVMGGWLGLLTVLIVGIFSISVVDNFLLDNTSLASVISSVLVDLTNDDRSTNALGELTVNPVLTAAAQAKADDMAAKGYFAHVSPEGKSSWYWFQQVGYKFSYAGENLAVDFSDSPDVERAWMNSPTHRKNILDGNFTEIGIAVARGTYKGHSTIFVAQMFGAPAHAVATAPVRTVTSPAEPTAPALATTNTPVAPAPAVRRVAGAAASTSRLAVAPVVAPALTDKLVLGVDATGISQPEATWWEHVLASPKALLRYGYYALAGIILLLLAYVTELEFHRRHTRHVAAAFGLVILMAGLFTFASVILFSQPVLAALPQ